MLNYDGIDPMPDEYLFDGNPIPLAAPMEVPPFPVDALPGPIADMVKGVSEATQTDQAMAGTCALAVVSGCNGGRAKIEIRSDWQEPLNTYTATVAHPGERKSAVQRSMTHPLVEVERELAEAGRQERLEAEARRQIAIKAAERRRQAVAMAIAKGQSGEMDEAIAATSAAEEIVVPPAPRLIVDDITPEAAASLLAEQDGRLALISAEAGVFGIIAGRYSNDRVNMDLWLKGHSGDEMRVDRKGRPPEYVPQPALTVSVMIQPPVLTTLAANREFRGRGLLARFLYALPAQMVGKRKIGKPVTPEVKKAYVDVIATLAKSMAERAGDPVILTLTDSARVALETIEAQVEPTLAGSGELAGLADWGAKYVGAIARIAGNLHLADHGLDGLWKQVTEDTILAAVRIGEYFKACAINAFIEMGGDQVTADAAYLLDRIARQDPIPQALSERDMLTIGSRARFRNMRDLGPVVERLVDHGYLALLKVSSSGGRPPSPRYRLHPGIAETANIAKGLEEETLAATAAFSAQTPPPEEDEEEDESFAIFAASAAQQAEPPDPWHQDKLVKLRDPITVGSFRSPSNGDAQPPPEPQQPSQPQQCRCGRDPSWAPAIPETGVCLWCTAKAKAQGLPWRPPYWLPASAPLGTLMYGPGGADPC